MTGGEGAEASRGGDDYVSAACLAGKVPCACVAYCDRGVAGEEQLGHGLADDQAPADDHRPLSGAVNAVVVEYPGAALGCAGAEAPPAAGKHPGEGDVGYSVHILGRVQRGADGGVVDVPGQGTEDEYPVDGLIPAQGADGVNKLRLAHVLGQYDAPRLYPHSGATLHRPTLIGDVRGVFTHAHQRQRRHDAHFPKRPCTRARLLIHPRRHRRALQKLCHPQPHFFHSIICCYAVMRCLPFALHSESFHARRWVF